jgi:kynurenine 3-monooxygenase
MHDPSAIKKVVIIGAGPAGLLLGHYLLRSGPVQAGELTIALYDEGPDPRHRTRAGGRSFPLAIQARGMWAIRGIPQLEEALCRRGIWGRGVSLHGPGRRIRQVDRTSPSLMISRQQLVLALLESLVAAAPPDRLTLAFDCPCEAVDLEGGRVRIGGPRQEEVPFDVLVAADGARSLVRTQLAAQGLLTASLETVPDAYITLELPFPLAAPPQGLAADRLHTWNIAPGTRLIMAPQRNGTLSGTLVFPPGRYPLAGMESAAEVLEYFAATMPALEPLLSPELVADLPGRDASRLRTVRCDRLQVDGRVLLLGDAAHAVSASVGQGCNAALQDARIVAERLEAMASDWSQALPAFERDRRADIDALRELSDHTLPRTKAMLVEFLLRLSLGRRWQRWFPWLLDGLPMHRLMETDQPYAEVLAHCRGWIDRVRRSDRGRRSDRAAAGD